MARDGRIAEIERVCHQNDGGLTSFCYKVNRYTGDSERCPFKSKNGPIDFTTGFIESPIVDSHGNVGTLI